MPGEVRSRRRLTVSLLSGLVALFATGCVPSQRGAAGVTVDGAGRPVAVLTACGKSITRVSVLYIDPKTPYQSFVGTWKTVGTGIGNLILNLNSPDSTWESMEPMSTLKEGAEYEVAGIIGSDQGGPIIAPVDFNLADVRRLTESQVLIGPKNPGEAQTIVSISDFYKVSCKH